MLPLQLSNDQRLKSIKYVICGHVDPESFEISNATPKNGEERLLLLKADVASSQRDKSYKTRVCFSLDSNGSAKECLPGPFSSCECPIHRAFCAHKAALVALSAVAQTLVAERGIKTLADFANLLPEAILRLENMPCLHDHAFKNVGGSFRDLNFRMSQDGFSAENDNDARKVAGIESEPAVGMEKTSGYKVEKAKADREHPIAVVTQLTEWVKKQKFTLRDEKRGLATEQIKSATQTYLGRITNRTKVKLQGRNGEASYRHWHNIFHLELYELMARGHLPTDTLRGDYLFRHIDLIRNELATHHHSDSDDAPGNAIRFGKVLRWLKGLWHCPKLETVVDGKLVVWPAETVEITNVCAPDGIHAIIATYKSASKPLQKRKVQIQITARSVGLPNIESPKNHKLRWTLVTDQISDDALVWKNRQNTLTWRRLTRAIDNLSPKTMRNTTILSSTSSTSFAPVSASLKLFSSTRTRWTFFQQAIQDSLIGVSCGVSNTWACR